MKLKNNEIEFLKNLKDNYYHDKEERELDEKIDKKQSNLIDD